MIAIAEKAMAPAKQARYATMRALADDLRAFLEARLARYKLPKAFVFRDEIVRSPSGKADYRWAKQQATG